VTPEDANPEAYYSSLGDTKKKLPIFVIVVHNSDTPPAIPAITSKWAKEKNAHVELINIKIVATKGIYCLLFILSFFC
jgi:hypothetical protein